MTAFMAGLQKRGNTVLCACLRESAFTSSSPWLVLYVELSLDGTMCRLFSFNATACLQMRVIEPIVNFDGW